MLALMILRRVVEIFQLNAVNILLCACLLMTDQMHVTLIALVVSPAQKDIRALKKQQIVSENVLLIPTAVQDGTYSGLSANICLPCWNTTGEKCLGDKACCGDLVCNGTDITIGNPGTCQKKNKGFSLFDKSFSLKHLVGIAVVMVATWGL